jgi:hypothetical protein
LRVATDTHIRSSVSGRRVTERVVVNRDQLGHLLHDL